MLENERDTSILKHIIDYLHICPQKSPSIC